MDVIHGVGHRTITPGISYPGDRRGMADARLVVDVIGAPHTCHLAEQISLLIAVLGRT